MNTSTSLRFKRNAGMSLLQIMVGIIILGIVTTASIPDLRQMIWVSKATQGATLQDSLNDWYSQWTTAGGRHNTAAGNAGDMAFMLMNIMNSAPSSDGTAPSGGATFVDETRMKQSGVSIPGSIRMEMKKPYVMDTGVVLVDDHYEVTFDTKGTADHGVFTVSVRN